MKRKPIALFLGFCMGAALLGGCETGGRAGTANGTASDTEAVQTTGTQSESAAKTGEAEKVTLHYYAWSEGDYLQEMVDAYNAASDSVYVEMTQVNSSEYDDKLMTMLAGTNDIDVFNMRSGSLLTNLGGSGNLVDITQMISDSGMDISIYGTGYAETKVNDRFYGLPYRSSAFGLFYNKKIFDEKGIPYPDDLTWEEYADLAKEMTEGEGSDKVYGGYIPDWSICPYMVIESGSNLADDDLSAVRQWWEMLNRLYNIDNSHMSYSEMKSTGTDAIHFFCSGKAAMYPGGEWSISDVLTMLKNDPQIADHFELGIAAIPQMKKDGEKMTIGGVSTFIGINATSKKQEAAFDFISYMAGKDAAEIVAAAGAIPAYIDEDIIAVFEGAIGTGGAANLLDIAKTSENLFIPEYTELQNIYKEEKELYLIGEQSAEDAVKNFEERRAEVMNR